jgi:transposase
VAHGGLDEVEYATLEWVDWFNHRRLLEPIGHVPRPSSRPPTIEGRTPAAPPHSRTRVVFSHFSGVVLLDSVLPNERSSMGRRGYPPEFRRKVLDLVEAERPIAEVAQALDISEQSIYTWRRQDRIDRSLEPGLTSTEKAELVAAKRRIAELETELQAMRRAMELVREVVPPKGGSRRSQ